MVRVGATAEESTQDSCGGYSSGVINLDLTQGVLALFMVAVMYSAVKML